MFTNLILLQAAPAAAQGQSYSFLIMMALVFVVMYFFMIRPQTKRQKELRKFQEALKKGDKIVTTGGIYGKVWEIREQYIIIEIDDNCKIRCDKSAILRDPSDLQQAK
ncbi:preprotein translocase subunit YajC [Williamwhitmania taraxaci]|uniref:Sec translocon accessory complex subunit YajC n=1 Tax=Williamwhitmania taraxaci TaxID=1640674 RepID=A0A1G6R677_9BACT|nr:preprotein translocase subunit YajC [Williamwhitmania taraxaci]SDC99961.1 preprotein translocase subunit YajC [Williamwhitmania taraxaci]